jgi:hypothetical protein
VNGTVPVFRTVTETFPQSIERITRAFGATATKRPDFALQDSSSLWSVNRSVATRSVPPCAEKPGADRVNVPRFGSNVSMGFSSRKTLKATEI